MRRALILTAGLLALSCGHSKPKPTAAARAAQTAPADSAAAVAAIPGLAPRPGEKVAAFDIGRGGRPDTWKYSVVVAEGKEILVRKERDLNGDGKVDLWEAYDDEGNVAVLALDLDFDGKPDLVITYEKGQLVKKELAPGFDGMARTTAYYENGKLVRKERDTKGDGKIDTWEYYENGELDRVGVDLDGDGEVDRWTKREGSEEEAQPEGQPPPVPPAGKSKAKQK
jgi:hypothetical protein